DADYAPQLSGVTYSRDGNPTYRQAEQVPAKLEGAADAMLFASDIAAGSTLLRSLSAGDHLVIPRVMYHGLREWVHSFLKRWGLAFSEVDPTARNALEAAIHPGETKLVWIETPCKPTWDVTDIAAAAVLFSARLKLGSCCGACGRCIGACDNPARPRCICVPFLGSSEDRVGALSGSRGSPRP
ncbi:MAG: PLP-dependent transferase, partial [Pseudomonadota bacterium]|nr:PLP-dependent transferase [Pseudomonadota bacterium]